MTDLLIKILNLPIAAQRVIALSVISTGFLLVISVVWAAFATLNRQADEIVEGRRALARFEQLIAMDDGHSVEPETVSSSAEFLAGENEAVIQAGLQNKLNSIALSAGASVLSAGGIQATEKNGVKYVGIRANLQGSLPAIHKTLLQLEAGKPYVTIRELTVRGINASSSGRLTGPIELSVQLSFFGALNPAGRLQKEAAQP